MVEKITACFICACHCGLVMTLDDNGKITNVRGDNANPRTQGFICNKGVNSGAQIDSPHRLTRPLKRIEGKLKEISWERALDEIAEKIMSIRGEQGPRSIGMVLGGSPHPTAPNLFAVQMLQAIGSKNLFSPISLEFTGRYLANQKMFGCSYLEGHPDLEHSRFVILIGTNPMLSHPLFGESIRAIAKDPDRTLVVIDPRRTETAKLADLHLFIRPSTDIYFLLGMMNVIISNKFYDARMARDYSTGLEQVAKSVSRFTPEAVSEVTGIAAEKIIELATRSSKEKPALIHYDMGVIANHHSTLLSWAVKTLSLLNGSMGVPGGLKFNPTLLNWNRAEKFAFPGKKYTSRVRGYPEITGHMPITVLQDEILTPGQGQIKALVVNGCNPLRTYANAAKMERAFKSLELLVSVDPFLTEVGRLAHYVLPSCSFHEQDNISFQFEHMFPTRFVQLTQKIREPLGESWPEWKIYTRLTSKLGLNFMGNPVLARGFDLAEWIAKVLGSKGEFNPQQALLKILARLGGTSYKELGSKPHGFSLDHGRSKDMLAEIKMPGGKARLGVPEFLNTVDRLVLRPPLKNEDYPLILSTTCRDLGNVNTIFRNEKWIEKHLPENRLVMHPNDAYATDVSEESRVRIVSRTATADVALALSEDALPGTVYLKGGWGIYSRDPQDDSGRLRGTAAAMFVPDDEAEEYTGMPFLSGIPVRVEKIRGQS